MITQPFVHEEDFHKLTGAEAKAFVIFELMELNRHRDDIKHIRVDIQNICKVHGIEGLELNAIYSLVYGVK